MFPAERPTTCRGVGEHEWGVGGMASSLPQLLVGYLVPAPVEVYRPSRRASSAGTCGCSRSRKRSRVISLTNAAGIC
jgi:hypothetical protein